MKKIIIVALLAISMSSCSKNGTSSSHTFTVSGTILTSCGGTAVANVPVRADLYGETPVAAANVYGIGNATTDAQGHFSMHCSVSTGGYLVLGINGQKYVQQYHLSSTYPDIDFKNIYGTVTQTVCVKVVVTGTPYTSQDTLQIGASGNVPVYPIESKNVILSYTQVGTSFLDQSVVPTNMYTDNGGLRIDTGYVYWGIGYADYNRSVNSVVVNGSNNKYHMIPYIKKGCDGVDTVVLNLP